MHICRICQTSYSTTNTHHRVCPKCLQETKPCSCGCGRSIQRWKTYKAQERQYVHGHNGHAKWRAPMSQEVREKIRRTKDGWPLERTRLLKEHYPHSTANELRRLFPSKNLNTITTHANKLGLHKTPEAIARTKQEMGVARVGAKNWQWKGGRFALRSMDCRGPNWTTQRRRAKKRDAFTCQSCGVVFPKKSPRLHAHHIVPFRTFGYIPSVNEQYLVANQLSNLVSLCEECHSMIETANGIKMSSR